MAANLEKILQDVQALSLEEQQQVRQRLEEIHAATTSSDYATEETFRQRLIDADLLRTITRHGAKPASCQRHKRVAIQGKPLSETIIEERR